MKFKSLRFGNPVDVGGANLTFVTADPQALPNYKITAEFPLIHLEDSKGNKAFTTIYNVVYGKLDEDNSAADAADTGSDKGGKKPTAKKA